MAASSSTNPGIRDLITRIELASENVSQGNQEHALTLTPYEKRKLLAATKNLTEKLEGPDTTIWKVVFGPQAHACLQSAFKMRIFEVFDANEESISADDLSAKIGAEKLLTVRIMRALCSVGIFDEVGEEEYAHNLCSQRFTDTTLRTMMIGLAGTFSPYMSKLPDYLDSTSFKNPEDSAENLFRYATGTELDFFDWLHTQPRQLDIFSAAMAASSARQEGPMTAKVSALFPADDSEHRVLMVDVGGGRGQILNALRKARPDLKGQMIVQDLPREIDGRHPSKEVQGMAYDFFTPQPIQAAHTYFFRHIFHDWSDQSSREILLQTIPAMKRNYSRIVIMDAVLPSVGAPVFSSLLDINMIALAGIERTDRHWRSLLEGVGLKVLNVEVPPMGDGIIEAVLTDNENSPQIY